MDENKIKDIIGREISVFYKDKDGNKVERTDVISDIKKNENGTYDIYFKKDGEK